MLIFKKIFLQISSLLFVVYFLIGCGGGGGNSADDTRFAVALLGRLADANATIYLLEQNFTKKVIFSEKTSNDNSDIEKIGKFNAHLNSLKDEKFYIYEVKGGIDKDSDNNGIIDAVSLKNSGKIRLVSKGKWLKEYKNPIHLTIASEILYLYVHKYFYKQDELEERIRELPSKIFKEDINNDNKIDINDIFAFDPVKDIDKLYPKFKKSKIKEIVSKIHENDTTYADDIFNPDINSITQNREIVKILLSKDNKTLFAVENSSKFSVDKSYQVKIFDIANPLNISLMAKVDINGSVANDFALCNDEKKIYIADTEGLNIFDISDLSSIRKKEKIYINGVCYSINLSKDAKVAYLDYYADKKHKLAVIKFRDDFPPQIVKYLDITASYEDFQKSLLAKKGDVLYICEGSGLQSDIFVLDIANADNPSIIGSIKVAGKVSNLLLSQDERKLFVNVVYGGLKPTGDELLIYDVTMFSNPVEIGKFKDLKANYNFKGSLELSKDGNLIYSSALNKIRVIDIKDINRPILKAIIGDIGNIKDFVLSSDNSKIYISSNDNNISVLDNLFDHTPAILKRYFFENEIKDIVLSNTQERGYFLVRSCNYYIGGYHSKLMIYDIKDLFSMKFISEYESPDYTCGEKVRITDDHTRAYIYEDFYKKLLTVDLSYEIDPCLLNRYDTKDTTNLPFVYSEDKSRAYKRDPKSGNIEIYDITHPFNPVYLYEFNETPKRDVRGGKIVFEKNYDKIDITDKAMFE